MRGNSQLLARRPIGTSQDVEAEADLGADVAVREVENPVEGDP
jgi:hypothetical protein